MALAKDSKFIPTTVVLKKTQDKYLKKNRYPRSEFMRQAVKAHKEGRWKYITPEV